MKRLTHIEEMTSVSNVSLCELLTGGPGMPLSRNRENRVPPSLLFCACQMSELDDYPILSLFSMWHASLTAE